MQKQVTLRAQTILYNNDIKAVEKSVCSIENSIRNCINKGGNISHIELCFGDASPNSILSDEQLLKWKEKYGEHITFSYKFFGFNSGTSKGQNILFKECTTEYLMLYNPDIVVSPNYFIKMMECFDKDSNAGMIESRQIPLEHPKDFNCTDGSEIWGAMACVIVKSAVYRELGGLDEKNFFLYCDDVDFSWRIRLSGRKVIYQPNASVFHGHRIDKNGGVCPSEAELYYSAESALLMAYKWSNDKWLSELIKICSIGSPYQKRALDEFNRRKKEGLLTERLDPEHKVAKFINGNYSNTRY